MATDTLITRRAAERLLVEQSFLDFLNYVWIPDPPPAGKGIVKFEKWPHLLKLHEAVEAVPPGSFLPGLKARKIGWTSYFEARFLWIALFQFGSVLPVLSQGANEAMKIIADCRFIWEHLPDHLRVPTIEPDNSEVISFKGGGAIRSFPATAKAGRSYTGTDILIDEADFHENFEASFNALLPLIQDTRGKMFVLSTANPDLVDSPFRRVYNMAEHKLFQGYFERPGRTEQTYGTSRKLASDEARFEKENPRTEVEALAPPKAMAYFDADAVGDLAAFAEKPREYEKGGLLWIWKRPMVRRKYIGFGDVAWGEKGAYSCVVFADYETLEQVAEIYGRPPLDELALWIVDTAKELNNAYIGIEANGEGLSVVNTIIALGYGHRMYHHGQEWRQNEKHRGYLTSGSNRPTMLENLAEFVRARAITPRCRDATVEMLSFVRTEKAGKLRAEPSKGAYGDHVMAWAGLLQVFERATFPSLTGENTRVQYIGAV